MQSGSSPHDRTWPPSASGPAQGASVAIAGRPGGAAFRDKPELGQKLFDALGAFALFGSGVDPAARKKAPISWTDELGLDIYVVIPVAGPVGVATTAVRPPAPHEAAELVVARALARIGYTTESATIDREGIVELQDPTAD